MKFIKKHFNLILVLLVFLMVLFSSIAYSAMNTTMNIDGSLVVRAQADIRIVDFQYISGTTDVLEIYNSSYTVSSIKAGILLPYSDSSATYQVTVKNIGDVPMKIEAISDYINSNSNIGYRIEGYQLNDKISSGSEITFQIIYYYVNYDGMNTSKEVTTDFSFSEYKNTYIVTYDESILSYLMDNNPTSVFEGDTLTVFFNNLYLPSVKVTMGGNSLNYNVDYTSSDNSIVISNVTGNIILSYNAVSDLDYIIYQDSITLVSDKIAQSSSVNITDYINMSFNGINLSGKTIIAIDVSITYTSITGSTQSVNCILTNDGSSNTQKATFNGKTNNGVVTFTFNDLLIPSGGEFTITSEVSKLTNTNVTISEMAITPIYSQ